MKRELKEIKNTMSVWKPTVKGDEIEGNIIEVKAGDYGKQYLIDDARIGSVWTSSHKVLQARLSKKKVGDYVSVVFDGLELPKVKGQNPTSMYQVFEE